MDIKQKTTETEKWPEDRNYHVPTAVSERSELLAIVAEYAQSVELVPPLQKPEIQLHTCDIITKHPEFAHYTELIAVMINNEAWRDVVGSIPFNRRLLLLPKCFRDAAECPAQIDELGILCEECGRCDIGEIMHEAEELGYTVLVSEGTTSVSLLLASGQIECVIGVACLHSFERSFPHVISDAIPSLAIPLQNSNCMDSQIDRAWLSAALQTTNGNSWNGHINLNGLKKTVKSWFSNDELMALFQHDNDPSVAIACDWMSRGGKLWRPFILASFYSALTGADISSNDSLKKLAVSIECFHKASLAHDDIEDDDNERYGQDSLHVTHGMPVALNTGDLLIGLGYQMIAACAAPAQIIAQLTAIASKGHRELCLGQGNELLWNPEDGALTVDQTTMIFKYKTSPAFEVAIKMAAVLAEADKELLEVISNFSEALGIAYQIKDDLNDFNSDEDGDIKGLRPSMLIALAAQYDKQAVDVLLKNISDGKDEAVQQLESLIRDLNVVEESKALFNQYRSRALDTLTPLKNVEAKVLMHRLTNRILGIID